MLEKSTTKTRAQKYNKRKSAVYMYIYMYTPRRNSVRSHIKYGKLLVQNCILVEYVHIFIYRCV